MNGALGTVQGNTISVNVGGNPPNVTMGQNPGDGEGAGDQGEQKFPVRYKKFIDLIMSEASTEKDAAGIGSVIINRLIAEEADLNDPDWADEIGTESQYKGFKNGQYKRANNMTLTEIQNDKDFKYMYKGAFKAFQNWGTDYTGMPDGHKSYYWNKKGYRAGGEAIRLFKLGKLTRNTIDGSDFYSFKSTKARWTPN